MVFIFLPLSLGGTIFYWLFERRGTILLLGKFGRRLVETFYMAGVSFCGACVTWMAGHLDQTILLVWPYMHIIIMDEFMPYNAAHISQK